jgi:hypothetical protein
MAPDTTSVVFGRLALSATPVTMDSPITHRLDVPHERGGSELPGKDRLLVVLCGDRADEHPICRHARDLVHLHRCRREPPEHTAEYDCRRAELVQQIDRWIAGRAPIPLPAARYCPRTVRPVVDRATAERAMHVLTVGGARSEQMHTVWTQLGQVVLKYSDLVSDVMAQRCHLSDGSHEQE